MADRPRTKIRIFNSAQRHRVHETTRIDPFIIDRCCSAYEDLINRDDVEGYRKNMLDAIAQLGFGMTIPIEERPTAVDKMKRLALMSIAKQWGWDYQRVARWCEEATKP